LIGYFVSVFFYFFLDVRKEEEQPKGQERLREEEEKIRKMWIRKEPDTDGYLLLQSQRIQLYDMFLTAKDASSLTVERK
jgi:hypothetical protein